MIGVAKARPEDSPKWLAETAFSSTYALTPSPKRGIAMLGSSGALADMQILAAFS